MEIRSSIIGHLVAKLRREFKLTCFFESGTCHGDTAELAAIAFDKVFTCEIDPSLLAESRDRLAHYDNVTIAQKESPEFIRSIKEHLCQPTMYWLDGHWSGGPVKPSKECPLLEELEAIGGIHEHGSVILVDDIEYMIKGPPAPHDPAQWPEWGQVQQALDGWGEKLVTRLEQGPRSKILVITPGDA